MMLPPSIMRIRIDSDGRKKLGLWLPLILIWPLVLVLVLAIWSVLLVVAVFRGGFRRAFLLLPWAWVLFCAARGLRVDVRKPGEGFTLYVS